MIPSGDLAYARISRGMTSRLERNCGQILAASGRRRVSPQTGDETPSCVICTHDELGDGSGVGDGELGVGVGDGDDDDDDDDADDDETPAGGGASRCRIRQRRIRAALVRCTMCRGPTVTVGDGLIVR
jgi:hypothetical protein